MRPVRERRARTTAQAFAKDVIRFPRERLYGREHWQKLAKSYGGQGTPRLTRRRGRLTFLRRLPANPGKTLSRAAEAIER